MEDQRKPVEGKIAPNAESDGDPHETSVKTIVQGTEQTTERPTQAISQRRSHGLPNASSTLNPGREHVVQSTLSR